MAIPVLSQERAYFLYVLFKFSTLGDCYALDQE